MKEININVQYCLTNLQQIKSKIDDINTYLDSIDSNVKDIRDNIINTNQKLEQGNQLQEESNQLQKDQNDFLKQETSNNDVSIDSFDNVDSNDITSSGLMGIFNTIYNSINSWSSKDINLPIPFTNKSINIPSNYTSNMLNKVGRPDFNQYCIYYLLFFSC